MLYTNGTFTGTYNEVKGYLNASPPIAHPENWPQGPWLVVEPDPYVPTPEQQVAALVAERDYRLDQLTHTFTGGGVIQVRPVDELPIRNAIERMHRTNQSSQQWRMADSSSQMLTIVQLQEALESGQDQGAGVWAWFFQQEAAVNNSAP